MKAERKSREPMSHSEMIGTLKSNLRHYGESALRLADELSSMGERLDHLDRAVVESTIDSIINGCLKEARVHALTDNFRDFEVCAKMASQWMELKHSF